MSKKKFYIKERDNFQAAVYYVPLGQLSKTEAKRKEKTLAGENTIHEYETEAEYNKALEDLRANGKRLHS